MKKVYEAGNGVEAHMVLHMLEQQGIEGRIDGEYLAGGVGDLPAMGLVRVMVEESDIARAREIIAAWERKQPAADPEAPVRQSRSRTIAAVLAGTLIGGGLAWIALRSPFTEEGVDFDGDGRLDEKYFYAGGRLTRMEADRNADGRTDAVYEYDLRAVPRAGRFDEDFNGEFELTETFENGWPALTERDLPRDGVADYREHYAAGVVTAAEFFDPASGYLRKRISFTHGWPASAQLDTDGDGRLETEHIYDSMGEISSTRRVP